VALANLKHLSCPSCGVRNPLFTPWRQSFHFNSTVLWPSRVSLTELKLIRMAPNSDPHSSRCEFLSYWRKANVHRKWCVCIVTQ
jgi:hypothetical protein